jgi:hypothetical protein
MKPTYRQPQNVTTPNCSGYPEEVANTQTVATKGKGAATRGYSSSKGGIPPVIKNGQIPAKKY